MVIFLAKKNGAKKKSSSQDSADVLFQFPQKLVAKETTAYPPETNIFASGNRRLEDYGSIVRDFLGVEFWANNGFHRPEKPASELSGTKSM